MYMITVHHLENSRSQRILWLLEELGLPYELKLYKRDPKTKLAPPELKNIHPLGKSPVITDDGEVVAESAAIIEYLVEKYGAKASGDLAHLQPRLGTPEHRQCRFWMHYAEGSLMNWLVMKLVFMSIPKQPMPFFVRPIAKAMCGAVIETLINPNLNTSLAYIDDHLSKHHWFSGADLSMADFQMSFPVDALLSRSAKGVKVPHIREFKKRMEARPAYQRALAMGGPTLGDF
jgi:glutathione S-transferase